MRIERCYSKDKKLAQSKGGEEGKERGKDVAARDVQDVHPAIRSGTNEPCIFVRANIF